MSGYIKRRSMNGDEYSLSISRNAIKLDCFLIENEFGRECNHSIEGEAISKFCSELNVESPDHLFPVIDAFSDPQWNDFHETVKKYQTSNYTWSDLDFNN